MNLSNVYQVFQVLLVVLLPLVSAAQQHKLYANAVAVNDQQRKRPFFEALENQISAIEVELSIDKSGEILAQKLNFEKEYLKNIIKILPSKNGWLFDTPDEFFIFIRLKDDPEKIWDSFCKLIARNSEMFTSFPDGIRKKGPLRLVICGKLPSEQQINASPSYFNFMLPLEEHGKYEAWRNPVVELNYKKLYKWKGESHMPNNQYHSLISYTKNIHKVGKYLRVTNTYEGVNYWNIILGAGVDYIDIEQIQDYIHFVKNRYK